MFKVICFMISLLLISNETLAGVYNCTLTDSSPKHKKYKKKIHSFKIEYASDGSFKPFSLDSSTLRWKITASPQIGIHIEAQNLSDIGIDVLDNYIINRTTRKGDPVDIKKDLTYGAYDHLQCQYEAPSSGSETQPDIVR